MTPEEFAKEKVVPKGLKSEQDKTFEIYERMQKAASVIPVESTTDLIREKLLQKKAEEKPPTVLNPPAPPPTFKIGDQEFILDYTVVVLCCLAQLNNKKVNKVLKSANIIISDMQGKKFFPKAGFFKRILRKLIED